MELIIDFDSIKDSSKKGWLLSTLKLTDIIFHSAEKPQSLEEYNEDLEEGNAEIESSNFITARDLKKETGKW